MEGRMVTSVRETKILHCDEAHERGSHACNLTYKERGEKVWDLATLRVLVSPVVFTFPLVPVLIWERKECQSFSSPKYK